MDIQKVHPSGCWGCLPMSRHFPPELETYIRNLAPTHTANEIVEKLAQDWPQFSMTYMQLTHYCERRGIARKSQRVRKYSEEYIEWLRKEAPGSMRQDLLRRSIEEFGLDIDSVKLDKLMTYYGIHTGVDTTYKKGQAGWNKGTKGLMKRNSGSYQTGRIASNRLPVGTMRKAHDGFYETKYEQPDKWMLSHRLIWIQAGRELNSNDMILFADGNKENLSLDNLIKVTRSEMGVMKTTRGMHFDNPSVTRVNVALAKLRIKNRNLKKKAKEMEVKRNDSD